MSKKYDVYKPTKLQVLVPFIVLAVTLVSGGIMLGISKKLGVENEKADYMAPGIVQMQLNPGHYTIYLMNEADYEGKHYSIPKDYKDVTCKVIFDDQEVTLEAPENDYSFGKGEYQGKTFKEFDADKEGDYTLETSVKDNSIKAFVIAVGKKDEHIEAVVTLSFISAMIMLMGVLQFIGYLILNGGKMAYYLYKKKMDV